MKGYFETDFARASLSRFITFFSWTRFGEWVIRRADAHGSPTFCTNLMTISS